MKDKLEEIAGIEGSAPRLLVEKILYTGLRILAGSKCGGYIPIYDDKNDSYISR